MGLKINKIQQTRDVYDIQVENTHNFYANDILVHNCEIVQASKPGYTPQCTLASINLAEHDDIKSISKSVKVLVRALNKVIDKNKWSDDWSKNAGEDQRAIAIGVAGMADFFAKKKISFESDEAKEWTDKIFETMYKSSVTESMLIAQENNKNYPAWEGSKYSKGETYIEDWSPLDKGEPIPMYNSLLLGLMPTASCFEINSEIRTSTGNITYKQILEDNDIDWENIENNINSTQVFKLKNKLQVDSRHGLRDIEHIIYNGKVETLAIEMEDGTIFQCTYNHKFLVNREDSQIWVRADELLENDDIVEK